MLIPFAVFCAISVVVMVFLTVLCFGKKKKNKRSIDLEKVSYSQQSGNHGEENEDPYASVNLSAVRNTNESDIRTSNQSCQNTRTLPDIPPLQTGSLQRPNSYSDHSSLASGELGRKQSNSPKGRRLPTPPNVDDKNSLQTDDDDSVYAKVNDPMKPSSQVRMKIKTLDIREGSGDSSFYAKVGEVAEDADLYAQVNDNHQQSWVSSSGEGNLSSSPPSTSAIRQSSQNKITAFTTSGPEYATIDKVNKKQGVVLNVAKEKSISEEPPAPPIPDRNFIDSDDEDVLLEEDAHSSINSSNNTSKNGGPTYDKVCFRESLDHLRQRQEAEDEISSNYVNIKSAQATSLIACNVPETQQALYAQIDEPVEAVYESLSGSIDGNSQPSSTNIPNHSGSDENSQNRNNNQQLSVSPQSEYDLHHYEQIIRK